jgi:all-trans-8'-apo-beta-carotenal 15,15'-oxygenase
MTKPNTFVLLLASQLLLPSSAFLPPANNHVLSRGVTTMQSTLQEETLQTEIQESPRPTPIDDGYWEIAPTIVRPNPRPLTEKLRRAMETNTHPEESQSELGRGVFCTSDWRRAWNTYESPSEVPDLIDPDTGLAEYPVEVEGDLPDDLVGVLYRNGPGKMGVGGERVAHTLDGDGMILKITVPPPDKDGKRTVMFRSRFVETEAMVRERQANRFLYRGTFGTGPSAFFDKRPKNGLNSDPIEPSNLSKVIGRALNTDLKNTANTQVISFAGKVLALYEAGLPHAIDPETLETLGEDTLGGVLKKGLPVKLGDKIPRKYQPDFIGGTAHTAHPNGTTSKFLNLSCCCRSSCVRSIVADLVCFPSSALLWVIVCPKSGNLVGWHWSQLASSNSLEVTFTEWSAKDFTPTASNTFEIPGCELAPHDMGMTDNYLVLKVNSLKMDKTPFLLGLKGPAASLSMDGRAPVQAWIFPRPTSQNQFEPFSVEIPACFSIHFSHSYEHPETGNIVSFFSGWPPSDSKDFLGAW